MTWDSHVSGGEGEKGRGKMVGSVGPEKEKEKENVKIQ
jgi:hypothetical protein